MPRFFFNVHNDALTIDDEGSDLADVAQARDRAIAEARNFAAESIQLHGHLVLSHRIEILDADGNPVARIAFGEAVTIIA